MATTALFTLMEAEFQSCLVRGTSVQEEGVGVSIKPLKDETIRFYRTDCDPARDKLSMDEDELKSCDYVVLYLKVIQNNQKELLCFLELKGSEFEHAISQIENTCKYMMPFWKARIERDKQQYIVPCACICLHGSGPSLRDEVRYKKRLHPFVKSDDYIHVKHGASRGYTGLGQFLRKLYTR